MIESSRPFRVKTIRFKSNVGRDISSAKHNLLDIAGVGSPEDFIFFVNRSAFGPRIEYWYHQFISQIEKFPEIGMCGNTINRPCPGESDDTYQLHVQTYAFLTRLRHFKEFTRNMPGENAQTRDEAIQKGEFGISRRILEKGLGLTPLAWPDHQFKSDDEEIDPELPCGNMTMTPGFAYILEKLPYVHWHDTQKAKRASWHSIFTSVLFRKNQLLRYLQKEGAGKASWP